MESLQVITGTIGLVLLVLGIIATVAICEVLGRKGGGSNNLRAIHRWTGRLFIVIALGLFVYMFPRAAHLDQFLKYL